MIDPARVRDINDRPLNSAGQWVLYWMQASVRTHLNHALEFAIQQANQLNQPLLVCFGLMDDYPEANERSYAFLLEGLHDVQAALEKRGIRFVVRHGPAPASALHFRRQASLIVCDRNYLRHHKAWRQQVAEQASCKVFEVESEVVVPVEVASDKHEYAARTLRPKIHRQWDRFLVGLPETKLKHSSLQLDVQGNIDVTDVESALKKLKIDRSVKRSPRFVGGQTQAHKLLRQFLQKHLDGFSTDRNEPADQRTSLMSGYLHFGHISPIELALAVKTHEASPKKDRDVYLEELIVRRELSMNFCNYVPNYDSYECLPEWARKTLSEHRRDPRQYLYSRQELEDAKTHDPYWNAAQREMTFSGFMHNYMRMYWGKKILEWTASPEEAFETTLYLNNKYFLCGRDANSFCNVAWIYGMHDRAWGPRRKIFGLIRYMNAAGLERKFNMDEYVKRIDQMRAEPRGNG
jgi:deoxyribodipyrimidine photo-lyase